MLNKGGSFFPEEIELNIARLRSSLSEDLLERLASKTGFKQRSSKITPCIFMDLLLYCASLKSGKYSLSQGSAYLFETFGICSSKQSINKRFNLQAMNFIKAVLSHLVKNYIRLPLDVSFLSQSECMPDSLYPPPGKEGITRGKGGNIYRGVRLNLTISFTQ